MLPIDFYYHSSSKHFLSWLQTLPDEMFKVQ